MSDESKNTTVRVAFPFKDMQVWQRFVVGLRSENRFTLAEEPARFVELLIEYAKKHKTVPLPSNTSLFRARINESSSITGHCIVFEALFNNPQPGSVHVDFLLVDLRTGEVWHGPNPPCELVSSPFLKGMKKKLRTKYEISEADAERAKQQEPCCVK